ncbi:DUF3348 family protein [Luteimonas terricola]|uniref:DUF3348 family protein n=1 Tax=Luteimonas terricola TaxID=645597 RepID=A0ABQ2EK60_9GAMM|nr:DUF3348 family protein [Luteimonas terricola]GGK14411.1 hypothetical protein GCM10011394_24550 [Luteimonas terricola]
MLQVQTPAPVPGASLARLLARLTGLHATPPTHSAADRLGDWLDWQRAVALSRVLDDAPASVPGADVAGTDAGAATATGSPDDADARIADDYRRRRAALEDAITDDARDWTLPLRPRPAETGTGAAAGAAAVLRHCQGLQRDMQAATGRLRGDLRERLAQGPAGHARLAGIDAAMEGLLAPREHALLAPVVPALVARFERLHALHGAVERSSAAGSGAWRASFRSEARQVLLAELDLRFQPIEALLAALRSPRLDA